MRHAGRSKLGLALLALALPLGGLTPARADFTPNPNQQITVRLPSASMTLPVDGDMPFVYETDDGQEAVGYLDGWQRLENGVSVPLGNFGVGTHTVKVHPVLSPEHATEVSFQVTPGITTLEDAENVLVHLRIEPQSLSRIVPGSLKIVEVNGIALQPAQYVSATLPLTTATVEYRFPLSEAVAKFSKATLTALTNGQPAKRIALSGTLAASGDTPQQDFLLHDNVDPDILCDGVKDKFIFERMWGDPNAPSDALSSPNDLAVDRIGGFVYVINGGTKQIVKYDTSGAEILRWGGSGSGPGQFSTAVNIAVSADGQAIYVTDNGLNRVQKFNPQGQFLLQWGAAGTGDGQFSRASGVAVAPDGSVYVGDQNNGRIQKFDANGVFQLKWGSLGFGPGQFSFPGLFGIGVAPDASVYATDIGTGRVQRFTATGTFVLQWSGLASPFNIAFSPDGGTVYVTENSAGRVKAFDPTGILLFTIGSFGSGDGQFRAPYGVGTDGAGNVYVADSLNNRVTRLTATGTFIAKWGEVNTVPTGVGNRCAVDNQGSVYFTFQTTIQKYDVNGGFLTAWGGPGTSNGKFSSAADVAVSPDGLSVYAIDRAPAGARVQKFSPDGAFVLQWAAGNTGPAFLDVDSQGNVYVAQQSPPLVKKYSPTGTFLLQWGSTGSGDGQFEFALLDVAIDRSPDTVYILEFSNIHSVQTFSSQGAFLSNWGLIPGPGRFLRAVDVDQGSLQGVYLTQFAGWKKFKKDMTFVAQHQKSGTADDAFQGGTPLGIAVDSGENLYVPDANTGKVKKFQQGCKLPPTAVAGPDQAAGAYLQVALDGSASHDNGGGFLVSSVWSFSDGSPNQTGLQTTHRFYQPGIYTATLTVTDDDGMTASDSATINVVSGPTAVIQASSLNVPAGTTVNFSGAGSSDPAAAITSYSWTFGDGGSATGASVSHAFALSGTYPVTLTVEDALGLTGTAQVQIPVTSIVPQLFSDLEALIRTIPHQGTVNSLLAKLNAARASFEAGQINTAMNQLNALLNEVQAQTGKKIDAALAAQITSAVAALQQQIPAGEQAGVVAQAASPAKQTGVTARLLAQPFKVQITKAGQPLAGETVSFRLSQGSGILVKDWDLSSTTNAEGLAGMRFLCPSKAGASKVQALRRAANPQTGQTEDQVLAEFSIDTRAPSIRVTSGSGAATVLQENAGQLRYSVRLGDALDLPYEGQDIEYRFTDASGNPLTGDRGIILPRSKVSDASGAAHAAYVSEPMTPTGTIFIQARPLPPVKDEAGNPVAVLFGAISVQPEPPPNPFGFGYGNHDILKGNGQVVLPSTETGGELLVHFVPNCEDVAFDPSQCPPRIEFAAKTVNTMRVTTGALECSESFGADGRIICVRCNAAQDAGIKLTVANTREPQFIQTFGSTPFHGQSDMAVGQPEVYLVRQEGSGFVPAKNVLPTTLEDLPEAAQYFVETRMPPQTGTVSGGVISLDVGKDEELPANAEFVAPTKLANLVFQKVEENDRYSLWRTQTPILAVVSTLPADQPRPAVPPGAVQVVSIGSLQPVVAVGNAAYPKGILGKRKRVVALEILDNFNRPVLAGTAASDPRPMVEFDPISPADVQVQHGLALFTLKGTVRDAVADIVPDGLANLATVMIEDEEIDLQIVPDDLPSDPLRRPYPFKGRFEQPVAMPLASGDTAIRVSAKNVLGYEGGAQLVLRSKAVLDEESLPSLGQPNGFYLASDPLLFSVPATFNPAAPDTVQAGLGLTATLQPLMETGPNTLIFVGTVDGGGTVQLTLTAPALNPGVADLLHVSVTGQTLGLENLGLDFLETGLDTRLFKLTSKRLRMTLPTLSPLAVDQIQVALDSDTSSGTSIPLTETGPATLVFSGAHPDLGQVSLTLALYGTPDNALQETLVVSVTTQTPAFQDMPLAFLETTVASNEFGQTDLGFNLGGTTLNVPGVGSIRMELQAVLTPSGSDEGRVNKLVVRYVDLDQEEIPVLKVEGESLQLMPSPQNPGEFHGVHPLLGVLTQVPGQIKNLIDALQGGQGEIEIEADVQVGKVRVKVRLVVVLANPPPAGQPIPQQQPSLIKVPAGVETEITLTNETFAGLPAGIQVIPLFGGDPEEADPQVEVKGVNHAPGSQDIKVRLLVSKEHAVNVGVPLAVKAPGQQAIVLPDAFEVVELRTVILALDGVSRESFLAALAQNPQGAFASLFTQQGIDQKFPGDRKPVDPGAVLNALPSITYTNWATWLTGKTPKEHGVLGNAFFPRDLVGQADGVPFGCANRAGIKAGLKVTFSKGSFDGKDNLLASELGRLPQLFKQAAQGDIVYSGQQFAIFHGQYGLDPGSPGVAPDSRWERFSRPELTDERLAQIQNVLQQGGSVIPLDLLGLIKLSEHNAQTAALLDQKTAKKAAAYWATGDGKTIAPLQFLYFPGPDNVAHDNPNPGAAGADLKPLIAQHVATVTDPEFAKVLAAIRAGGWQKAVLFTAIGDHGLIDTPKAIVTEVGVKDSSNPAPALPANQRLAKVIAPQAGLPIPGGPNLPITFWRGGDITQFPQGMNDFNVVFAPSGGMAHLYVQGNAGTPGANWQLAPSDKFVQAMAQRLYDEQTGKTNVLPTFKDALASLNPKGTTPRASLLLRPTGAFAEDYAIFETPKKFPGKANDFQKLADGEVPPNLAWEDTSQRIQQETNDKAGPSRSGDIVLIMNSTQGVITVVEGDILEGWHGAPTQAESLVPMFFSAPGDLDTKVTQEVQKAKGQDPRLRSIHFRKALEAIRASVKKGP